MEKFIRDNVHGDIQIKDKVIMELINTKEFQRLRRIIQLGGGQFVFPGANHTRFSHCIGVFHVLSKFLQNEEIAKHIDANDQLILKIAGLLHDVGHGPFSHTFESVSKISHEEYSIKIILGNTEVNKVLKIHQINPKDVADVINGEHKNPIVNFLVSSQLDADRLDYLLRDSVNTGVNYSNLDIEWIIRNAKVRDGKIAFPPKTINALEHYLLGRYHMFKQIYNHKVSTGFDRTFYLMFKRARSLYKNNYNFQSLYFLPYILEILEDREITLENYLRLDDYSLMEYIKAFANEKDEILKDLASRIINRRFLGATSEITMDNFNTMKKNHVEGADFYFEVFKMKPFILYKDETDYKDENIYILKDENKIKLTQISTILNTKNEKNNEKIVYIFDKDNVE